MATTKTRPEHEGSSPSEVYLSPEGVCEIIPGMTVRLLSQMRFRGDGPAFIKPSPRKVIYAKSELERFLGSRVQDSTARTTA